MKFRTLAAAAVAATLLAFAPAIASAAPQDFALTNSTGYTIKSVFVSPTTEDQWGDDILGSDQLGNGAEATIHFPGGRGETCNWDLKVTYDDDTTAEWKNFDLCTITQIDITYDKDAGTTSATWK